MSMISSIFGRRRLFNDLNEEMRLHIEERTEQLMREGMSQREAERQARVRPREKFLPRPSRIFAL